MTFTYIEMIKRLHKYTNEKIKSISLQKDAYSNHVYLITTEKASHIYKEYITASDIVDKSLEIDIQNQIGFPKIVFHTESYRFEEYIEHDKIDWQTDYRAIAHSLRKFHDLEVNCNVTQKDLLDKIISRQSAFADHAVVKRLQNEMGVNFHKSDMKLCHNDLQVGNMMKIGNEVKFIDFEYSCLGDVSNDIANLFCEAMCDYSKDSLLERGRGFSEERKRDFLRVYLEREDVEEMFERVCRAESFCHFYWFLWARFMFKNDCGPAEHFDYKDYAVCRLRFLLELGNINIEEFREITDLHL